MRKNDVIVFVPYGSRLGFHVNGPAATMANIDYKFPQCVCYEDEKHMEQTILAFKERAGCPGSGKGILIAEDKTFTLATNFNGAICYEVINERCEMPESMGPTKQTAVSD